MIEEEFPEWDAEQGAVVWAQTTVDPMRSPEDNALGEELLHSNDIGRAISTLFPELFDEQGNGGVYPPDGVSAKDWVKHRFCSYQLVYELFCEASEGEMMLLDMMLEDS